ncbi:MAG: YceI family protein [Candidatus Roseilinea sp.]|uniref:YceI family protein n=1 Tax=Candidatus Roseilinea sp. TaxID=2838777 RepID=UPI004049C1B0
MTWQLDPAHSSIQFVARHMMLSKVRGEFEKFTVDLDLDAAHPEQASVQAHIEAGSLNTREPQRDAHLKSPDFLNAAEFPELVFKSTRIERTGETTARVHGDLTIRGVIIGPKNWTTCAMKVVVSARSASGRAGF